jgi:hypothetical protein
MRRAARVDANHAAIVAAYRQFGYLVLSLAGLGDGVPDLLVSRRGQLQLVEVKTATGTLTPDQQQFIAGGWPVKIVRGLDDVLETAPARPRKGR